jgi:sigma-B regulation protein RsbU (phosphoserine phosphatase)
MERNLTEYEENLTKITAEKERIGTELALATRIQADMLPTIYPPFPDRSEFDIYASMAPAKEVGGDFYDVFFVDKDRLCFVVADVSGKGIPAALFMANSKTTIQNGVRDIPTLAEAAAAANEGLCRNNTAEMFVTAWLGVLELTSGKVNFVCAGHNPPVLISEDKASFVKLKGGFVFAGLEGVKYREHSFELKKGQSLFLYTDGVTEAENSRHELYGEERLLACLENAYGKSPEGLIAEVKNSLDSFVAGFDQFDDITMLCIRYKGERAPKRIDGAGSIIYCFAVLTRSPARGNIYEHKS